MKLRSWMWNLGAAGLVATAGCGGGSSDNDGEGDCAAETSCPDDYDDYYEYQPEYDDDDDRYDDEEPECREDAECSLGYCDNASSACVAYPRIPNCDEERPLELAWVRRDVDAGRAKGVVGRTEAPQRILMVDAEVDGIPTPLSLVDAQSDALATALPLMPTGDEVVLGLEEADLDGDGDPDLLVTFSSIGGSRVVPLLLEDEGFFVEGDAVRFEGRAEEVRVRRDGEGGNTLYLRDADYRLLQARGLGDGSFAEPEASAWGEEVVRDFVVAPLQTEGVDDVLSVVLQSDGEAARIDALIGDDRFSFAQEGAFGRQVFADPSLGSVVTAQNSGPFVVLEQLVAQEGSPRETLVFNHSGARSAGMADLDGDGEGDLLLLPTETRARIVFSASSARACVQAVVTEAELEMVLTPSSGTGRGIVLTGSNGVLAIRGASE